MALLTIATIPDPALKQICEPITQITPAIISLAHDIVETIQHHKNCTGIAAPQVGHPVRLVVIDISLYPKKHENHGRLILINPSICDCEGRRMGREGCLSVPELTANVTRWEKVTVRAIDLMGKDVCFAASGFEAVAVQHEIDHLDGILFLDRVSSLKTDVFRRKNA